MNRMPTELDVLLQSLSAYQCEVNTFNPWSDYDPIYDHGPESPQIRKKHLEEYLRPRISRVKYILVAEAVGYQGGKFSGVPMTSERILLGHQSKIPASSVLPNMIALRTSCDRNAPARASQEFGYAEPTATIVWDLLLQQGLSPLEVILWNIFPFHPFHPGRGRLSNRTPKREELRLGREFFRQLIALCPAQTKIIALGTKSAATLDCPHEKVRHPAQGGAAKFRIQLPPLLKASGLG